MERTPLCVENGQSQADPAGDLTLPRQPESWDRFFKLRRDARVPSGFMADRQDEDPQKRDWLFEAGASASERAS
jgi:hypothetical protein